MEIYGRNIAKLCYRETYLNHMVECPANQILRYTQHPNAHGSGESLFEEVDSFLYIRVEGCVLYDVHIDECVRAHTINWSTGDGMVSALGDHSKHH